MSGGQTPRHQVEEDTKGTEKMGKGTDGRRSLAVVIAFWREHKTLAVLLVLGTMATTAIGLAFPYILRFIVDGIKRGVTQQQLVRYVLLLTGFGLVRAIAEVILPWNRGRINEKYQWLTRSRVFRKALDMGHSFTNRFPTGDVMERLDHDLEELSWFACSGLFRTLAAVFTLDGPRIADRSLILPLVVLCNFNQVLLDLLSTKFDACIFVLVIP